MEQYDVLVIGGGPGGYSLGIAAAKKGLKVALFEKEHLGGTCLNVGCIPTKYLVDKANAMEKVRALVKKDIFRDAGSFSFKKIQQGKGEVTAKLVGGVKYLLKKAGADVITGEATLKADRVVSCGGKDYQGKYVVIATGSVPMMIPVPGHELCIDSTGALNLPSLPRSMVVMGGGVIGLELACAFAAYGTEITVVEMMPELMPREQKEAVRIVVNALKKQGIALKTGAKMLRIEKNGGLLRAVYEIEGKEEYTDCEQVLMAAGRKTNLSGIDAEALGLELDRKKCIVVDKYQHTSLPGVYAIGDVVGGYQLAHAAYAEGEARETAPGDAWPPAFEKAPAEPETAPATPVVEAARAEEPAEEKPAAEETTVNPVEAGPAVAPKDENGKFDTTKIAEASDFTGIEEESGCKS